MMFLKASYNPETKGFEPSMPDDGKNWVFQLKDLNDENTLGWHQVDPVKPHKQFTDTPEDAAKHFEAEWRNNGIFSLDFEDRKLKLSLEDTCYLQEQKLLIEQYDQLHAEAENAPMQLYDAIRLQLESVSKGIFDRLWQLYTDSVADAAKKKLTESDKQRRKQIEKELKAGGKEAVKALGRNVRDSLSGNKKETKKQREKKSKRNAEEQKRVEQIMGAFTAYHANLKKKNVKALTEKEREEAGDDFSTWFDIDNGRCLHNIDSDKLVVKIAKMNNKLDPKLRISVTDVIRDRLMTPVGKKRKAKAANASPDDGSGGMEALLAAAHTVDGAPGSSSSAAGTSGTTPPQRKKFKKFKKAEPVAEAD